MSSPRLYDDLAWVWPFVSPPEEYPEEVATFRRRFQQNSVPDGAHVLHLGSGGGSIDVHLKEHYRVTGVDLSAPMRAHATRLNPEVEYLAGDIRDLRLGRTFDAVLLHDASAYMISLEELLAAYRTAAAHLRPGGVMVTLPEEIRACFEQNRTTCSSYTQGNRTVSTMYVDHDPDETDTWFESTFIFYIREGNRVTLETDTHRVGLYHLDDMLAAMRDAGFEPEVSRWELADLDPDEDRPLVTAIKHG
ncbi:MAG TPA: class I SAM-dependent methyltransferase [Polyangium sp.]|nr:class I SAM-dependent methyltransferase [Polyangium sp.]